MRSPFYFNKVDKKLLIENVLQKLNSNLELLRRSAKASHSAATDEENQPDNKYDTLALEASYLAQGQANRAAEIEMAIENYQKLTISKHEKIKIGSLVKLIREDGSEIFVFLGPDAGGLKVELENQEISVVTLQSPLGKNLFEKEVGDSFEMKTKEGEHEFEIEKIW